MHLSREGRVLLPSGQSSVDGERASILENRCLFGACCAARERPALHHNRYEIAPFSPGARSTHWTSNNPAVGALRGRFVVVGDAILSLYASPTGRYRGYECIQQRDAMRYTVRGSLLEEDKLLSTWALDLIRL